jgi:hypothetical protein
MLKFLLFLSLLTNCFSKEPVDVLGTPPVSMRSLFKGFPGRGDLVMSDFDRNGFYYNFSSHPLLRSRGLDYVTAETRKERLPLIVDHGDPEQLTYNYSTPPAERLFVLRDQFAQDDYKTTNLFIVAKIFPLYSFIKAQILSGNAHPERVVIFADAVDVLWADCDYNVTERYLESHRDVVLFGAQSVMFEAPDSFHEDPSTFPDNGHPGWGGFDQVRTALRGVRLQDTSWFKYNPENKHKYLNSGYIMASYKKMYVTLEAFLSMVFNCDFLAPLRHRIRLQNYVNRTCTTVVKNTDQYVFQWIYLELFNVSSALVLDSGGRFVVTLQEVDWRSQFSFKNDLLGRRFVENHWNSEVCFMHFPGKSKSKIRQVIDLLNEDDEAVKTKVKGDYAKITPGFVAKHLFHEFTTNSREFIYEADLPVMNMIYPILKPSARFPLVLLDTDPEITGHVFRKWVKNSGVPAGAVICSSHGSCDSNFSNASVVTGKLGWGVFMKLKHVSPKCLMILRNPLDRLIATLPENGLRYFDLPLNLSDLAVLRWVIRNAAADDTRGEHITSLAPAQNLDTGFQFLATNCILLYPFPNVVDFVKVLHYHVPWLRVDARDLEDLWARPSWAAVRVVDHMEHHRPGLFSDLTRLLRKDISYYEFGQESFRREVRRLYRLYFQKSIQSSLFPKHPPIVFNVSLLRFPQARWLWQAARLARQPRSCANRLQPALLPQH